MARAERESAASAPWLQSAQPDSAGQTIDRLPGLTFAFEQFALNIPAAVGNLLKLDGAADAGCDPRGQPCSTRSVKARAISLRCCIARRSTPG